MRVGHISPKSKDYLERIVELRQWLERIIESVDGDIEVAIEDIQLQENEPGGKYKSQKDLGVTTYKKLAHVQGAILSLLIEKNIKYHIIHSHTWKKGCGIKGYVREDQKRNAQQFVIDNYKIKPTQDEADAVCIGHYLLDKKEEGFDWS